MRHLDATTMAWVMDAGQNSNRSSVWQNQRQAARWLWNTTMTVTTTVTMMAMSTASDRPKTSNWPKVPVDFGKLTLDPILLLANEKRNEKQSFGFRRMQKWPTEVAQQFCAKICNFALDLIVLGIYATAMPGITVWSCEIVLSIIQLPSRLLPQKPKPPLSPAKQQSF